MSDNGELMLEILKSLQAGQSETLKSMGRLEKRMTSMEFRFSQVEQQISHIHGDAALFREDFDDLKERVQRIERRLELHDPAH